MAKKISRFSDPCLELLMPNFGFMPVLKYVKTNLAAIVLITNVQLIGISGDDRFLIS